MDEHFDIFFIDILMHDLNGSDVAARLRNRADQRRFGRGEARRGHRLGVYPRAGRVARRRLR